MSTVELVVGITAIILIAMIFGIMLWGFFCQKDPLCEELVYPEEYDKRMEEL